MGLPPISVLTEPVTCFPAWHTRYKQYGGRLSGVVSSGCSTVNGNVNCDPSAMAADAARKTGLPVTLEVYTLARYLASEVGNGPVEEKIAVAQAGVNRAVYVEKLPRGVVGLLLYRQDPSNPHYGYYGPIHGPSGVTTAPYGRWAATSQDPTVGDLILAIALTNGTFDGFNKGADDQDGLEYTAAFPDPVATVRGKGARRNYWVGPLPGVDHWRTFLWRNLPGVDPSSAVGQGLIARGVAAVKGGRPDWSTLPVCSAFSTSSAGILIPLAVAGSAALLGFLITGLLTRLRDLHSPSDLT